MAHVSRFHHMKKTFAILTLILDISAPFDNFFYTDATKNVWNFKKIHRYISLRYTMESYLQKKWGLHAFYLNIICGVNLPILDPFFTANR